MIEVNKVYTLNHKDILSQLGDKSVDLLVIDPPYGINIGKMGFTTNINGGVAKRNDYKKHDNTWDNTSLTADDLKELFRVSKNQVIFGANYIANLLPPSKCWLVWDKKTEDKYTNDFADCELIWTSFNKSARVIRCLWHGMIQYDMKHKEKRYHPTQKPLPVMKRIIEMFTQPNELILDCFCGSGSTLVAAKMLGRNFIGSDIQQTYVDITNQRLAEIVAPLQP